MSQRPHTYPGKEAAGPSAIEEPITKGIPSSRLAFFAVSIALLFAAGSAQAATITVNSTADSGGTCPGAGCTLRQAIATAVSGDTINFSLPANSTITLTSGQIVINKNLAINGPAAGIVVQQQTVDHRIFFVGNGSANGPTVSISNLTIQDGSNPKPIPIFENGAGIYNDRSKLTLQNCVVRNCEARNFGGQFSRPSGGGVASVGSNAELTILSCYFVDNFATLGGGAVWNSGGKLTVTGSSFEKNDNQSQGGGHIEHQGSQLGLIAESTFIEAHGGAIGNSGPLEIRNCTFVRNRPFGVGAGAIGNSGNLLVQHCTFKDNFGGSDGNVRNFGAGVLNVRNTIVHGDLFHRSFNNEAPATFNSLGYNLTHDDGNGLLTAFGDQINTDAKLDPAGLQSNGGATKTIALITGSPAIDRGNSFGTAFDQRGAPRPVDNPGVANLADGSDIGAYEAPADPIQDGASSYVVRTAADHDDGICSVTDCTLREAIARTNAVPGPNAITFTPPLTGTITLSPAAGGQLNITEGVTIAGPGARFLKISANTQTRVLSVSGSGTTTISGLTIADGFVFSSTGGDSEGGGIYNQGTLSLIDCTLDFNRASGGTAFVTGANGGSGRGGGIFNNGAMTLDGCTFKNNGATGGSGAHYPPPPMVLTFGGAGGDGQGAAVYNNTDGSLTLYNCTFTGNSAGGAGGGNGSFGGNGGHGLGGAIFNLGALDVSASTFSGNSGLGGSGGLGDNPSRNGIPGAGAGALAAGSGTSTVRNSLSAGNNINSPSGHDVSGVFTSGGFNLIGKADGSTGFSAATDQTGTVAAPLLAQIGGLANNGGPTDTMAPLPASPAVDKGHSFGLTQDQRGVARPLDIPGFPNASGGDGSDIGAVELTPTFVTTLDDHDDGACTIGDCTLREAINAANAQSGDDTIAFSFGVTGAVQLNGSLPTLSTNMVIAGPGANLLTVRRNSGGNYRVFVISNAPAAGPNVTITGLTIANGLAPSGGTPIDSGGGILNDRGTLTVRECVLTGNASNGGTFSYGGGIFNHEGTLTVDRSTLSANTGYYGGGIANRRRTAGVGTVTVTNSTFVGNTASYGLGIYNEGQNSGCIANVNATHCTFSGNVVPGSFGGGIYNGIANSSTGTITLSHCTFAGNSAAQGSSVYNFNFNGIANVTLRNSIFATSSGSNLVNSGGSMTSLGYNLSNDAGAGVLNNATDLTNTDPLLAALGDNGGPTQTHALLFGSPAIDKGLSNGLTTDQRGPGYLRIIDDPSIPPASGGDNCDIGAFERGGVSAVSRKMHGAATFDIDLPLTGPVGIECRTGGTSNNHQFILSFPSQVSLTSASVSTGTGSVDSFSVNGAQVMVNLTGVANAQTIVVTLFGVNNGTDTTDVSVPMGVLLGDTNGNRTVNATDIGQTKSQSGQLLGPANFRTDVNANGSINATDIGQIKSQSGTSLP